MTSLDASHPTEPLPKIGTPMYVTDVVNKDEVSKEQG